VVNRCVGRQGAGAACGVVAWERGLGEKGWVGRGCALIQAQGDEMLHARRPAPRCQVTPALMAPSPALHPHAQMLQELEWEQHMRQVVLPALQACGSSGSSSSSSSSGSGSGSCVAAAPIEQSALYLPRLSFRPRGSRAEGAGAGRMSNEHLPDVAVLPPIGEGSMMPWGEAWLQEQLTVMGEACNRQVTISSKYQVRVDEGFSTIGMHGCVCVCVCMRVRACVC